MEDNGGHFTTGPHHVYIAFVNPCEYFVFGDMCLAISLSKSSLASACNCFKMPPLLT